MSTTLQELSFKVIAAASLIRQELVAKLVRDAAEQRLNYLRQGNIEAHGRSEGIAHALTIAGANTPSLRELIVETIEAEVNIIRLEEAAQEEQEQYS